MLKKIVTAGAIYALACGVSFGKTGALEFVEQTLQGIEKSGIDYYCSGDKEYAACRFKSIDTFLFNIENMRAEVWLTDTEYKQKSSGNIVIAGSEDDKPFLPHSFECESSAKLQGLQNLGASVCILKSDVATFSIDGTNIVESKSFRYKSMPTLVTQYIATVQYFSNEYDRIQNHYKDERRKISEQKWREIDDLDTEIEQLEIQNQKAHTSDCNCGCNTCGYAKYRQFDDKVQEREKERKAVYKKYADIYAELEEQYNEDIENLTNEAIAWLQKYNITIQDIRVSIKTNKLAETLFATYAKDFLAFNEDIPLSKKEKLARAEEKKQLTGKYYAALESIRAAGITYIEQSPYLKPELKTSLRKVVVEYAKLFDPNSHKRSVNFIIKPQDGTPINLGDELSILFANKKARSSVAIHRFFENANRYDIKVVRSFE